MGTDGATHEPAAARTNRSAKEKFGKDVISSLDRFMHTKMPMRQSIREEAKAPKKDRKKETVTTITETEHQTQYLDELSF